MRYKFLGRVTPEQYITARDSYDPEQYKEIVYDYNKKLVTEFPFLRMYGDYSTEMDGMPDGWRVAFGYTMLVEIKKYLDGIAESYEVDEQTVYDSFEIIQIKEKYGSLRLYCGFDIECQWGNHEKLNDIIRKYEELSKQFCYNCGMPTKYITQGWNLYICEDCAEVMRKSGSILELTPIE